jgi:hypothetical protein
VGGGGGLGRRHSLAIRIELVEDCCEIIPGDDHRYDEIVSFGRDSVTRMGIST